MIVWSDDVSIVSPHRKLVQSGKLLCRCQPISQSALRWLPGTNGLMLTWLTSLFLGGTTHFISNGLTWYIVNMIGRAGAGRIAQRPHTCLWTVWCCFYFPPDQTIRWCLSCKAMHKWVCRPSHGPLSLGLAISQHWLSWTFMIPRHLSQGVGECHQQPCQITKPDQNW